LFVVRLWQTTLHTLRLWRVGMDQESLERLVAVQPACPSLANLILDNNDLQDLSLGKVRDRWV
jgi:hypothetical protein